MSLLQAILMGIIQGLTEFLPVSSSGHLALFKILFDVNTDTGILYDVLLHVGTLIAISLVYYRDILKLVVDGCCIIRDAGYNVIVFFRNKTGKEQMAYRRVINSSYRKFAMLIIVSTIPTGIIGYFCKDVVEMASEILIVPGICLIATAVLLLIADHCKDGDKLPKNVTYTDAFSVGIAQGIAGVDVFSGAGFRMVMWVVFTALGCGMTMFYAAKVKKTPEISVAYESDQYFRDQNEKTGIDEGHSFGIGHILVLVTLAVTVVWVIWGVMAKGYYMAEIATQFFIMGIVAGVIGVIFHLNDMKVNDIAVSFKDGAKDLIGAALVVAMAQGIMQVLGGSDPTTPTVINTIMYGISQALAGLSGAAAAVLMYVFQSVFNFFVVSGSGQAAITMPIMAPLADLLGVSRQTSVLAFQLGDAFTNLIVPTSGCLIGSLAIAKIEWSNWIKFMWKFLGILMIGAVITILIAVAIGF